MPSTSRLAARRLASFVLFLTGVSLAFIFQSATSNGEESARPAENTPWIVNRQVVANTTTNPPTHSPFPRLAADFEPQSALVLSVSDWQPHHAPILEQLVEKTRGHVPLLILCNDRQQLIMTIDWLKNISDQCDHVRFAELDLDTIWLRDFAPFHAETSSQGNSEALAIDFYYVGERPKDDQLPRTWSQRAGSRLVEVPFTLQGGNLLCNGQHLAVTTQRIFVDNAIQFPNPLPGTNPQVEAHKIVTDAIMEGCNLEQLVILEHLQSEATKHADMFINFVAVDKAVVASVDPQIDPINAAILDRNARRLQAVQVNGRPLQIYRLHIPPRDAESWSAFANVIIANDLVLMPIYKTDPTDLVRAAVGLYQKLLPNHTIKTVDITTFKQLQGELHCLSMNLPKFAALPAKTISYEFAVKALQNKD